MRYLKTYGKLFESGIETIHIPEDLSEDILDITLELVDLGFLVSIQTTALKVGSEGWNPVSVYKFGIEPWPYIHLHKPGFQFSFSDIEGVYTRIEDFLWERGWLTIIKRKDFRGYLYTVTPGGMKGDSTFGSLVIEIIPKEELERILPTFHISKGMF